MTLEQVPELPPAAARGSLVIDRGVVEKIASQAAYELTEVGRSATGLAGLGGHGDLATRPRATVQLRGTSASVALTIGVRYPTPLIDLTTEVRRRCAERVAALTGLRVDRVDVTVGWLGGNDVAAPVRPR